MKFRRRRSRPAPGGYPDSFTQAWIRQTLPTASPAEARALLKTMRGRGWTEAEVAERILPYMPPVPPTRASGDGRASKTPVVAVPPQVSIAWLDRRLPAMDRGEIQLVVEELERLRWPATEVAIAVLPHLLPKLPPADVKAILAGLSELGMTEQEIARLAPGA